MRTVRMLILFAVLLAASTETLSAKKKKGRAKKQSARHTASRMVVANSSDMSGHREAIKDLRILCVKRAWPSSLKKPRRGQAIAILKSLGFPTNHEVETVLKREGYDNEIVVYTPSTGEFKTVYKPDGSFFAGHLNLHWDGRKLLFSQSDAGSFKIYEINIDGTGLRRVSKMPDDIDCVNPCYLPDGRIVFNSTAGLQCVPCWGGVEQKYTTSLYVMNADGSGVRRLTFDQDIDFYPSVRHNGQVVFTRWDYTGMNRTFLRPIMTMNPDGTNQRAVYGSNSWFANGMYYPRELPGGTGRFLCVIAGYHGSNRSGILAVVDTNEGEREGVGVRMITGHEKPVVLPFKDEATQNIWPQFMTPAPVDNRHFLASAWRDINDKRIGIYLADIDNKLSMVHEEENMAFFEPIPLVQRQMPPALPDRVDLNKKDATIYVQDVYAGPGLKDVPRGTVKSMRVIAYDFGYIGLAGMDKIGLAGPWEAMRILGTAPVEADGSTMFKVPANTPIAFQPIDEKGRAVQLMRTWTAAMPGEFLSCVGCHESAYEPPKPARSIASGKAPAELEEWYGPTRGFDFEREVQPVLNRYCVSCHNQDHKLDLRAEKHFPDYKGLRPCRSEYGRLHPHYKEKYDGKVKHTPTYEALVPYIRRVNTGDDVSLLEPGEYLSDTSELIQIIKEGHKGIKMDDESWRRLYAWIDLNGPCHGTWNDVYNEPIPGKPNERRWELAKLYGGTAVNPDILPKTPEYDETPMKFDVPEKRKMERKALALPMPERRTIDLGGGQKMELVRVGKTWLMGACEISNAQFRQFDPSHTSRYYTKRHEATDDDKGWDMDAPDQPAVRVSWNRAMAFCEWLSEKTGMDVTLPTEEQWEAACLAGGDGPYHFNGDDFSPWENLADKTFATVGYSGRCECPERHFIIAGYAYCNVMPEGVGQADKRFADGGVVTMPVGSYKPNALGLHDMHGNACEWTLTDYAPGEKTVKGGSWYDRPGRAHVDMRRGYAPWRNVFNAGFRVVVNNDETVGSHRQPSVSVREPRRSPQRRANILFCLADDWGWPHAGAYGDKVVKTPTFDRLAREGVLFEHAYVSSPSCTPSRNALLTGQQFYRLGEGANLRGTLDIGHPNFMSLLKVAGYQTGHWRKAWGPGDYAAGGYAETPCGPETSFVAFMKNRDKGKPFCFWFGTSDPHRGYKEGSGKESGIDIDKVHVPEFLPNTEVVRSDIADYYFEVQRWDSDVANAIKLVEEAGELDNTIIVMSGDHGMPFPRCKANLYDWGARVPLAVRWNREANPGRRISDFVSFTDLAPTFLESAGIKVPAAMTGRSLLPIINGASQGRVDKERDFVVFGRERHVACQKSPSLAGYPSRAIRTDQWLLILNLKPDRWPTGVPKAGTAGGARAAFGDIDPGPTRSLVMEMKNDPENRRYYDLCYSRRPEVELYDCTSDPDNVRNLANDPKYGSTVRELRKKLIAYLEETGDPRFTGEPAKFDEYPYAKGGKKKSGKKKKAKKKS